MQINMISSSAFGAAYELRYFNFSKPAKFASQPCTYLLIGHVEVDVNVAGHQGLVGQGLHGHAETEHPVVESSRVIWHKLHHPPVLASSNGLQTLFETVHENGPDEALVYVWQKSTAQIGLVALAEVVIPQKLVLVAEDAAVGEVGAVVTRWGRVLVDDRHCEACGVSADGEAEQGHLDSRNYKLKGEKAQVSPHANKVLD